MEGAAENIKETSGQRLMAEVGGVFWKGWSTKASLH